MGNENQKPKPPQAQAKKGRPAQQPPTNIPPEVFLPPAVVQAPPPASNPFKNWRKDYKDWGEQGRNELKKEIKDFQLAQDTGVNHLNVLLVGQVSAGKSSFFNNIESVFRSYVTNRASAGSAENEGMQTFTKEFTMYKVIKDKDGQEIKFRFWDTMGLEAEAGLQVDQVKGMLDGDVPDGTDLSKVIINQEQQQPKTRSKIDCCVFIISAPTVALMDGKLLDKWFSIRELATNRGLTPIIVLTHVDKLCKKTSENPSFVFNSRVIGDKVTSVANKLGTTAQMVCPVVNYTSQQETEVEIDIMTLLVLRQILRACESRLA